MQNAPSQHQSRNGPPAVTQQRPRRPSGTPFAQVHGNGKTRASRPHNPAAGNNRTESIERRRRPPFFACRNPPLSQAFSYRSSRNPIPLLFPCRVTRFCIQKLRMARSTIKIYCKIGMSRKNLKFFQLSLSKICVLVYNLHTNIDRGQDIGHGWWFLTLASASNDTT